VGIWYSVCPSLFPPEPGLYESVPVLLDKIDVHFSDLALLAKIEISDPAFITMAYRQLFVTDVAVYSLHSSPSSFMIIFIRERAITPAPRMMHTYSKIIPAPP
jgi:hypothetical protein